MIKKIFILNFVLLFMNSCGFYSIDDIYKNSLNIKNYKIDGDKEIIYQFKNELNLKKNQDQGREVEILINVSSSRKISEKNKKNKTSKFSLEVKAELILKNTSGKILKIKNFSKASNYLVNKNSKITRSNKKRLTENLVKSLANEIKIFLKQYSK